MITSIVEGNLWSVFNLIVRLSMCYSLYYRMDGWMDYHKKLKSATFQPKSLAFYPLSPKLPRFKALGVSRSMGVYIAQRHPNPYFSGME